MSINGATPRASYLTDVFLSERSNKIGVEPYDGNFFLGD
jgi:hypothetical protein